MDELEKICRNCKFYTVDKIELTIIDKYPQCRRYAPRMLSGSGTGWSGDLFPKVDETFWCGEFYQREIL